LIGTVDGFWMGLFRGWNGGVVKVANLFGQVGQLDKLDNMEVGRDERGEGQVAQSI
jgi:hypothetical protein